MMDPKVFNDMVCGETVDNFVPPMQPYVVRLVVKIDESIAGLLWFAPWSIVCWEMHTCLLPHVWGSTNRIFNALKMYIWSSLARIQRIVLVIPESNKAAIACAYRNGMDYVGFNPKAVVRNGVLMGNHIFGISRPSYAI
jgi:hypothetical protein